MRDMLTSVFPFVLLFKYFFLFYTFEFLILSVIAPGKKNTFFVTPLNF